MAQEVRLQGRTYSDVPSILLPDSNNVFHPFTDVSDTTATASDVASGKYFYLADGTKTQGTSSGGGGRGAVTQDQDGYLVLDDDAPAPSVTVEALSVTQNGTYTAPAGTAYSPVTVSVSGGGSSWSWMGNNPTKLHTWADTKVYLANSAYATWTPTTTTTTLATAANLTAYSSPRANYDYYVLLRWHTHFEYGAGAEQKGMMLDQYVTHAQCIVRTWSTSYSDLSTDNRSTLTSGTGRKRPMQVFYNLSGTLQLQNSASYGVFPDYGGGSFNTTAFTPKTPVIKAACGNSYFSTANAALVNQAASYYEYTIELWRVDAGTSIDGGGADEVYDMWLNGF